MDWQVFLSSFGMLMAMEMGDKTQLAVLSLTAQTGRAIVVFLGAALALAMVTLVGVVAGAVAKEFIPLQWLSYLSGLAFIAIGALLLWSSRSEALEESEKEQTRGVGLQNRSPMGALAVTFGLLMIAEMGDKSQLAVVSMTVKSGSPFSVFLGASLALVVLTLLTVLAGQLVARLVPMRWISRGAALLFIVMGVLTLTGRF